MNGRVRMAAMFDGLVYEVFAREARALSADDVYQLVAAEWGSHSPAALHRRVHRSLLRLRARRTIRHHERTAGDKSTAVYVPHWMWRRWLKANSYTPMELLHEAASTQYLRSTGWRR